MYCSIGKHKCPLIRVEPIENIFRAQSPQHQKTYGFQIELDSLDIGEKSFVVFEVLVVSKDDLTYGFSRPSVA